MLQDDLASPRMDAMKLGHIIDVPVHGDPNLSGCRCQMDLLEAGTKCTAQKDQVTLHQQ